MKKYIFVSLLLLLPLVSFAVTKPSPDADVDSLSYVFFMYYNSNGQLFYDRDYEVKFDVINERFVEQSSGTFKMEIMNFKSEVARTIMFNPQLSLAPGVTSGKIQVKAPYVPDGSLAIITDNQNNSPGSIHIGLGSICNDDNLCDSLAGENSKTCPNDCKESTPRPTVDPVIVADGGMDYIMLAIYGVSGVAVALAVWFGWRWFKKKRGESFLPPEPSSSQPMADFKLPPTPPQG